MATACETVPPAVDVGPFDAPFSSMVKASTPGWWRARGVDRIEVWVCHVPLDSTAAVYGGLQLRRVFTPQALASAVSPRVSAYFDAVSHGRYRPVFVAGGEWTMGRTDLPQACADHAIAAAATSTRAVLLVADAEHAGDQAGGIGTAGVPCHGDGPCPVGESRRWAYVGAADFSPRWGTSPPVDLVEHELGHTLGWVHSGTPPATNIAGDYDSALDVMSDSAAPRAVEPARRDGPDTLAIDRVESGWLPTSAVVVADRAHGATAALSPSTGASGLRLMVLPVDARSFLTIELLSRSGFDGHLPADGVAVHLVRVSNGQLDHVAPMFSEPPYTALVQIGGSRHSQTWKLTVTAGWKVTAVPVGTTAA